MYPNDFQTRHFLVILVQEGDWWVCQGNIIVNLRIVAKLTEDCCKKFWWFENLHTTNGRKERIRNYGISGTYTHTHRSRRNCVMTNLHACCLIILSQHKTISIPSAPVLPVYEKPYGLFSINRPNVVGINSLHEVNRNRDVTVL